MSWPQSKLVSFDICKASAIAMTRAEENIFYRLLVEVESARENPDLANFGHLANLGNSQFSPNVESQAWTCELVNREDPRGIILLLKYDNIRVCSILCELRDRYALLGKRL